MRIHAKIMLACLGMASVTVLLGLFARDAQRDLGMLATRIYDEAFTAVSYLRSAQNGLNRLEQAWHRLDADPAATTSAMLPDVLEDIEVARERAMSPAGSEVVNRIRDGLLRLVAGNTPSTALIALDQIEAIKRDFAIAVEVYAADGYRYRRRAGEMVERSVHQTWVAIALALLAAVAITVALARSILPTLKKAVAVAQAIAAGRLDNHIEVHGSDEAAHLLMSLTVMQDSIAGALMQIRTLMAVQASNHAGELAAQHARLEAALGNMVQGLCLFGADGRLAVYNQRFAEMFGPPPSGATQEEALAGEGLRTLRDNGNTHSAAFSCDLTDGRTIAVSNRPVTGGGWVVTYEDITERRQAEMRVAHMARHDALTGLANRVLFREHMSQALVRARRVGGLAVLCLDLDRFKMVNDTWGHPVGDALLREVAVRLRQCTRETDLVVRLGGDEFAIVQEGPMQPTNATVLARRLVETLAEPFDLEGQQVLVGTSIGIALADTDGENADALLKCADLALYRAKAEGRGTWRLFEPGMDVLAQARRALELDLQRAIAGGQFELFYQPLVEMTNTGISGFEALLRWRHPDRGLVSPALFIPLAEEVGLIQAIGGWALRQACVEAASWPGMLKVAVNLSPAQFRGGQLARDVAVALAASGLAAKRLELEITETVLLQDDKTVLETLHAVRDLGVRVAMDDFGTGYSSLSYLRRFPFDKIKIDQSFVRGLGEDADAAAIVSAVVGLGRSLGMAVNAEGVETPGQLAALQAIGCDEVQGYFFSSPRPAKEIAEMLHRHGNATLEIQKKAQEQALQST